MFELRPPVLVLLASAAASGCAFPVPGGPDEPESLAALEPLSSPGGSSPEAHPLRSGALLMTLPDHGARVAVDENGAVVAAGTFEGTIDLGNGPMTSAGDADLFVVKLDPSGRLLWSRRFGGPGRQLATAIAVNGAGEILVAARTLDDLDLDGAAIHGPAVVLARLDPSGATLWSKGFPGSGSIGRVRFDPAGNAMLLGAFSGSLSLDGPVLEDGGGASSTFVAKLDTTGRIAWSKGYGDKDREAALGMDVDAAGDVVVVGRLGESFDFGGGARVSAGDLDAFVVKYNGCGEHVWSERFGDADIQAATAVTVDPSGNVVLTGYNYGAIDLGGGPLDNRGSRDMFLAKLGPSGEHVWSERFDGGDTDLVASDAAGNVLLAGSFRRILHLGAAALRSAGDTDVYLAKFGPGGRLLGAHRYGGPDVQYLESLTADPSGDAVLSGAFAGTIDLGDGPRTSPSGRGGFLARIVP